MKEKMKLKLSQEGFEFKDFGTYNEDSVDYPDYIKKGALALSCQEYNRGIFFCGSGVGNVIK